MKKPKTERKYLQIILIKDWYPEYIKDSFTRRQSKKKCKRFE